ncbi:MAG: hypothetical protein FJZ56_03670 [Chlamydiae bacterium]|nr:hypothetical protein [Chlamydiota bacterium]
MDPKMLCPCFSGKKYVDCCKDFHEEIRLPDTAEKLMRSRYSAYALHLTKYILKTTHPKNPTYPVDLPLWTQQIEKFMKTTTFENLVIHEAQNDETTGVVTFTAVLKQKRHDTSFTEQSLFEKVDGRWLYKDGIYIN